MPNDAVAGGSYNAAFYAEFVETSDLSADIVLDHLFRQHKPTSMLDVGCGLGVWLARAREKGVASLRGLDGPWVNSSSLRIDAEQFERIDFEASDWPEVRNVDLALSLEVAEHLSPTAGDRLVKYLCESSPVVLFSAAIPCQGGEGHRNEQWQSFWAERFHAYGHEPYLFIRRAVWNDPRVSLWYQQNIALYVRADVKHNFSDEAGGVEQMDVVHPRLYEIRVIKRARRQGLRRWLSKFFA
jgi:hypothetical protein